MRKAFTLIELVFVITIAAILFTIVLKPLQEIYANLSKASSTLALDFNINQVLNSFKKELDLCYKIDIKPQSFSCYQRLDGLFLAKDLKDNIGYSGIIIEKSFSFFSPKSNFYTKKGKTAYGVSQEFYDQIAHERVQDTKLWLLNLANNQSYEIKASLINPDEILFLANSFSGFYLLINGKISYFLKANDLYVSYEWPNGSKKEGILLENLSDFKLEKNKEYIKIKICKNSLCLYRYFKLFV